MSRIYIIIWIALLMESCLPSTTYDEFEIRPGDSELESGEITLCGLTTNLDKSNGNLKATRNITCEGSGVIIVRTRREGNVRCTIGYVAAGAENRQWVFRIDAQRCIYVDESTDR